MLSWFKILLFSWFSVKPLMADFSSLSPYLKLYDLGPVEARLVIPLPESSSVISPHITKHVTCFDVLRSVIGEYYAIGIEI